MHLTRLIKTLLLGLIMLIFWLPTLVVAQEKREGQFYFLKHEATAQYLSFAFDKGGFFLEEADDEPTVWILQDVEKDGESFYTFGMSPFGMQSLCENRGMTYMNMGDKLELADHNGNKQPSALWKFYAASEDTEAVMIESRERANNFLIATNNVVQVSPLEAASPESSWTPVNANHFCGLAETDLFVVNNFGEDIVVTKLGETSDSAEALITVKKGESVAVPVEDGADVAFWSERLNSYVGMSYTVPASRMALDVPYIKPGYVNVYASAGLNKDIELLAWSGATNDAPQSISTTRYDLGKITAHVKPAIKLVAVDKAGDFVGMPYTVPDGGETYIDIPYFEDNHVQVTVSNSLAKKLQVYTWDGSPDVEPSYIAILPSEAEEALILKTGSQLWFRIEGGEAWEGDFYTVTEDTQQDFRAPIRKGDVDADGVITDEEVEKIATLVVQKMAEDQLKATNSKPDMCWKDTYTRGVGTLPTGISSNACPKDHSSYEDGLCYKPCKPGYNNFATMCIPGCPDGFGDDPLHCRKPAPVTRSAFEWKLGDKPFSLNDAMARCKVSSDGRKYGCELANSDTIVYSQCPMDFKTAPLLTNLCTPECPADMVDIGVSCQKNTYDRGAGLIPAQCPIDRPAADAGLCYNECREGFTGVGPVCWNQCPKGYVNCGASCAVSNEVCGINTGGQVLEPLMLAANGAIIIASLGTATGGVAAANAGKAAGVASAKVGAKAALKEGAKQSAKAAIKSSVRAAVKSSFVESVKKGAKSLAIDTAVGAVLTTGVWGGTNIYGSVTSRQMVTERVREKLANEITDEQIDTVINQVYDGAAIEDFPYDALDPTGIAAIVVAYNHPLCNEQQGGVRILGK